MHLPCSLGRDKETETNALKLFSCICGQEKGEKEKQGFVEKCHLWSVLMWFSEANTTYPFKLFGV